MTVRELRKALEGMPPTARVAIEDDLFGAIPADEVNLHAAAITEKPQVIYGDAAPAATFLSIRLGEGPERVVVISA